VPIDHAAKRCLNKIDSTAALHCVVVRASANTTSGAAAADDDDDDDDDDASQCDVIAPHTEHLLLNNVGSCSTAKLVL